MTGGGLPPNLRFLNHNRKLIKEAQERKERWLHLYAVDPTVSKASVCKEVGISYAAFQLWCKDPIFKAQVDRHDERGGKVKKGQAKARYTKGFAEFRRQYFGHDTPWHQRSTVDAYNTAKVGDVTLVLMPPEHGKTTLTEDDFNYRFAMDPNYRITSVSNGQQLARKISRRVKRRMEPNGSAPEYVRDFGPFAPQTGEHRKIKASQPWGEDVWDVLLKSDQDERDYSFATGGWKSNIAGTRCDRLHLDDIQALNSLGQTDEMFRVFQQDMLSRPGKSGHTTIAGTRVGQHDFYEKVIAEFEGEPWFRLITFPAIVSNNVTGELEPLWPEDPDTGQGYSMEFLAATRKRVGEDAWWRNYMQDPRSSGLDYFDADKLAECCDGLRRADQTPGDIGAGRECWITLDPALGSRNTMLALAPTGERLLVLDGQIDTGLQRNEQIFEKLELLIHRLIDRGWRPSTLIIEAMNFQKGLARDDRLVAICETYGLYASEHLTGANKYDSNIGVPSMAGDFTKHAISLPYGDDYSKHLSDLIIGECLNWKPKIDPETGRAVVARGNRLRQDLVMALWFGWIRWNNMRPTLEGQYETPISVGGLPWRTSMKGLLIPTGRR